MTKSLYFVQLSTKWWCDDDITCSLAARGLWSMLLSNSGDLMTDGKITDRQYRRVIANEDADQCAELMAELVATKLLDRLTNGWRISNYLEWQQSKEQILETRAKAAARAKKSRQNRKNKGANTDELGAHVTRDVSGDVPRSHKAEEEGKEEEEIEAPPPPSPHTDRPSFVHARAALVAIGVDPQRGAIARLAAAIEAKADTDSHDYEAVGAALVAALYPQALPAQISAPVPFLEAIIRRLALAPEGASVLTTEQLAESWAIAEGHAIDPDPEPVDKEDMTPELAARYERLVARTEQAAAS